MINRKYVHIKTRRKKPMPRFFCNLYCFLLCWKNEKTLLVFFFLSLKHRQKQKKWRHRTCIVMYSGCQNYPTTLKHFSICSRFPEQWSLKTSGFHQTIHYRKESVLLMFSKLYAFAVEYFASLKNVDWILQFKCASNDNLLGLLITVHKNHSAWQKVRMNP